MSDQLDDEAAFQAAFQASIEAAKRAYNHVWEHAGVGKDLRCACGAELRYINVGAPLDEEA